MIASLYTGVSGIQANSIAMGVIGNNIANVTTPGYKSSRTVFQDIISRSLTGTSKISQVGRGVLTQSIQMLFSQSSFETTSNPTDLAIDGNGFFILKDQNGKYYYTRAGTFILDKDSKLVNPDGLVVQGWEVDEEGRAKGVLKDIDVSKAVSTAKKTENVKLSINLDANDDVRFHIYDWNNTLIVDGTTITITPGTYTGKTLADTLQRALKDNGFDYIEVSYDPISGKFKFLNTDVGTYSPTLDFENPNTTIESVLGFSTSQTLDSTTPSVESEYTPDVSGRYFEVVEGVNDTIVIDDGAGSITIPSGAYSGSELAQVLSDQLGGNVTYDFSTGKFTIVDTGGHEIDWTYADSTAAALFGFTSNTDSAASGVESDVTPYASYDIDVYNYSTSFTIYDSVGAPHVATVYFRKLKTNEWMWNMVIDSGDLLYKAGDNQITFAPGTPISVGVGVLKFSNGGALQEEVGKSFTVSFSNGSELNQEISVDFGKSTAEGGTGLLGTTQFAAPSATFTMTQDGYTSGSLMAIQVDVNGVISGMFTNGVIKPLAQIALATFDSPWGLAKEGGNLYSETTESGQPNIGAPNRAGKGKIVSNSIEQSNVDLANEFVKMIVTQKAFQANARVITTSDLVLNEIINMKR